MRSFILVVSVLSISFPLLACWNGNDSLVYNGPVVSFAADGRDDGSVYLVLLIRDDTGSTVKFFYSEDHGLSWDSVYSLSLQRNPHLIRYVTGNTYHDFHFLFYSDGGEGLYFLKVPGDFISPPEEIQIYDGQVVESSIEVSRGWGLNFSLACAWLTGTGQEDTVFSALSQDYGENWQFASWHFGGVPDVIKLVDGHLDLALDGADNLYIAISGARFFPETDSLEVFIRYSQGGPGGSWSTLRVTNNPVPDIHPLIAVAFDTSEMKVWVAFSHFYEGNYDLYAAYYAGGYFELDLLSAFSDLDEYPADLRSLEFAGQSYLNLLFAGEGAEHNWVKWSYCYEDQPMLWSSPSLVAEGEIALSDSLMPCISFSPGSPQAGALAFYCDIPGNGVYVDAPWFPGVREEMSLSPEADLEVELLPRSIFISSPFEGNYVFSLYDVSGRLLNRWTFRKDLRVDVAKSGIYLYEIEGGFGACTGKAVILR